MRIAIAQATKKARLLGGGALLVLASFAQPASAVFSSHSLTFVGCFDNGICYAGISPALVKPTNTTCAAGLDQVRWRVATTTGAPVPGGAEMSRVATAAFLAGKKITVNTYKDICLADYAQVEMISILP